MASQTSLLGAAGEYFVMSELLRRGFIAALAPQGVPNTDIVVTDTQGTRLCTIQVKTRRQIGADGGWHMKAKHETLLSDQLFYCFIDFGKTDADHHQLFIVPSQVVAEVIKASHSRWLSSPGKNGHVRKDSLMRRFLPSYSHIFGDADTTYALGWLEKYRNAWYLLKLHAIDPSKPEESADD